MEDLGIPKELLDEAAEMFGGGGFQLVVPPDAEKRRKKGYARWTEIVTVQKAYREAKLTDAGDTHMIYAVQCQIMPAGETKNGGRSHTAFNRVNYEAISAGDKEDGQYKMSRGTVGKLRAIAVGAAEIDISTTGLTGEILTALFPLKDVEDHTSPLVNRVLKVSFTDNENKKYPPGPDAKNQQTIDAWAAVKVPEEEAA